MARGVPDSPDSGGNDGGGNRPSGAYLDALERAQRWSPRGRGGRDGPEIDGSFSIPGFRYRNFGDNNRVDIDLNRLGRGSDRSGRYQRPDPRQDISYRPAAMPESNAPDQQAVALAFSDYVTNTRASAFTDDRRAAFFAQGLRYHAGRDGKYELDQDYVFNAYGRSVTVRAGEYTPEQLIEEFNRQVPHERTRRQVLEALSSTPVPRFQGDNDDRDRGGERRPVRTASVPATTGAAVDMNSAAFNDLSDLEEANRLIAGGTVTYDGQPLNGDQRMEMALSRINNYLQTSGATVAEVQRHLPLFDTDADANNDPEGNAFRTNLTTIIGATSAAGRVASLDGLQRITGRLAGMSTGDEAELYREGSRRLGEQLDLARAAQTQEQTQDSGDRSERRMLNNEEREAERARLQQLIDQNIVQGEAREALEGYLSHQEMIDGLGDFGGFLGPIINFFVGLFGGGHKTSLDNLIEHIGEDDPAAAQAIEGVRGRAGETPARPPASAPSATTPAMTAAQVATAIGAIPTNQREAAAAIIERFAPIQGKSGNRAIDAEEFTAINGLSAERRAEFVEAMRAANIFTTPAPATTAVNPIRESAFTDALQRYSDNLGDTQVDGRGVADAPGRARSRADAYEALLTAAGMQSSVTPNHQADPNEIAALQQYFDRGTDGFTQAEQQAMLTAIRAAVRDGVQPGQFQYEVLTAGTQANASAMAPTTAAKIAELEAARGTRS